MKDWKKYLVIVGLLVVNVSAIIFHTYLGISDGHSYAFIFAVAAFNFAIIIMLVEND